MKEFIYVFQITRKISFGVEYITLGDNPKPYFATSANELNRTNSDYKRWGQAQDTLLPSTSFARKFYGKWNKYHLKYLQEDIVKEVLQDIEGLKERYNYIVKEADCFGIRFYKGSTNFGFSEIVELCKMPVKKRVNPTPYIYKVVDKRRNGKYNEYMVEDLRTKETGVFDSNWLKTQVKDNLVINVRLSNEKLYFVKDKI